MRRRHLSSAEQGWQVLGSLGWARSSWRSECQAPCPASGESVVCLLFTNICDGRLGQGGRGRNPIVVGCVEETGIDLLSAPLLAKITHASPAQIIAGGMSRQGRSCGCAAATTHGGGGSARLREWRTDGVTASIRPMSLRRAPKQRSDQAFEGEIALRRSRGGVAQSMGRDGSGIGKGAPLSPRAANPARWHVPCGLPLLGPDVL